MGLKVHQLAYQLKISDSQLIFLIENLFINKKYESGTDLTENELKVIYEWTKKNNEFSKPPSPPPKKEKEDKSKGYMDFVVKNTEVILIDTSSLLQQSSINFLKNLKDALLKYNQKIILPLKAYEELQKHQKNINNPELSARSIDVLKFLVKLQKQNLLELFGDDKLDNFADNVFQMQITRLRVNKSVLLITNDINLGKDILQLNESKSVNGKKVFVQKVNRFGYFQRIRTEYEQKEKDDGSKSNRSPRHSMEKKFNLATKVVSYSNEVMSYSTNIVENTVVYDVRKRPVKLIKEIGKGGEGSVYSTSELGIVAKIYKKEKITKEKFDKLELMISNKIEYEGVCYPKTLLFNDKNEFVGYTMPQAEGKELRHFLFVPKKVFEMRNPEWKRKDLVELCLTILDKIVYLHSRNIILGDINPFNILVVSSKKVYFVDVDSFQVEGFPCPVGTDNFTAPEIQGKNYKDFLRTFGNEHFAVATLMFSILFLGKSPYSQTGGETNANNIRGMDFPYTFKEERADNTPKGQWRYIWSNLSYSTKKAFYETFQKGELHSEEKTRLTATDWQKVMRKYYQELNSGKLIEQDEIANEIYPNRFKVIGDAKDKLKECKICRQSFYKGTLNQGICRSCLNKGEEYYCARCDKELVFTNFEKHVRNLNNRFKYCRDCNSYMNSTFKRITCTSCYVEFSLTYKDKEFTIIKAMIIRSVVNVVVKITKMDIRLISRRLLHHHILYQKVRHHQPLKNQLGAS
ncbi:hypothetical protein [Psychrobacillus sp. NPDC093180]|uniref:protein kinase domain-containing protein n=1 Tax=Psychrobacillus sp. NPDC093180 TaxID=3364489 RepID=UPI00380EB6F5